MLDLDTLIDEYDAEGSHKDKDKQAGTPGFMPPIDPSVAGFITAKQNEQGGMTYTCSIDFVMRTCEQYFKLLDVLDRATKNDEVILYIYSYGGMVETGVHIITSMLYTKAKVTTIACGMCASIGAMIWTCGQYRKVTDNATLMFHMPSGGTAGKTADTAEKSTYIQQFFSSFMKRFARGLLSDDDITNIVEHRSDTFLPAETVKSRLAAIARQEGGEHVQH